MTKFLSGYSLKSSLLTPPPTPLNICFAKTVLKKDDFGKFTPTKAWRRLDFDIFSINRLIGLEPCRKLRKKSQILETKISKKRCYVPYVQLVVLFTVELSVSSHLAGVVVYLFYSSIFPFIVFRENRISHNISIQYFMNSKVFWN